MDRVWVAIDAAFRKFMDVWEAPLSVVAGLLLGALASLLAVGKFDDLLKPRACRFEKIASAFPSDQTADAQREWSIEACEGILGSQDKIPAHFERLFEREKAGRSNKENGLKNALRNELGRARDAEAKKFVFWKILLAAAAMLWLYAFNVDAFRKKLFARTAGGVPGPAEREPASRPHASGVSPQQDASSVGRLARLRFRAQLSANRWALFCYGFAASACVYFTASTAGTAASTYIYELETNNDRRETIRETIRELHFAQFLDGEVDPRAYDRLAWHFFFEEGDLKQGSSCEADLAEFDDASLKFRDDLDPGLIGNRLGQIIGALASCGTEGRPVRIAATGQSSLREFVQCREQSPDLNRKLAEKRALKMRDLFKDALTEMATDVGSKVLIDDKVVEYPFNFSDGRYHRGDGATIELGKQLSSSPYYIAQTAALVLQDPSQCDKALKAQRDE